MMMFVLLVFVVSQALFVTRNVVILASTKLQELAVREELVM
jgi:hypothetical protein